MGTSGFRTGDEVGEGRVVGEQQKTGSILIQPANGRYPLVLFPQVFVNRLAAGGVAVAGNHALGLVEEQVAFARGLQALAVQLKRVAIRADPNVRVAHGAAVDLHPARHNRLARHRARSKAKARKHPVEGHGGFGRHRKEQVKRQNAKVKVQKLKNPQCSGVFLFTFDFCLLTFAFQLISNSRPTPCFFAASSTRCAATASWTATPTDLYSVICSAEVRPGLAPEISSPISAWM